MSVNSGATPKQPGFGAQVRKARLAKGLSQTDLAGSDLSPSYISLIESGRRTPNPKSVKLIAERLGMTPEELMAPELEPVPETDRLSLVSDLVTARAGRLAGDLASARDRLREVVRQAEAAGAGDVAWEARWELAAVLGDLRDTAGHAAVLELLAEDSRTKAAPMLALRVAAEIAGVHRATGTPGRGIRRIEEALRAADAIGFATPELVRAQATLASLAVETGDWDRAAALGDHLLHLVDDIEPGQTRLTALWAAAGARYLAGDPDNALDTMARAEAEVTKQTELSVRIRLSLANALLHLASGRPADAAVERTRQAVLLAGDAASQVLQAILETVAALRARNVPTALAAADRLRLDAPGLTPLDAARGALAAARAYRAGRRKAQADDAYRDAADRYERAGALRHSVDVWREFATAGDAPQSEREVDCHAVVMP